MGALEGACADGMGALGRNHGAACLRRGPNLGFLIGRVKTVSHAMFGSTTRNLFMLSVFSTPVG